MPRRIPPTQYPAGAERDYFAALRKAIRTWFAELTTDLLSIGELRADADLSELDQQFAAALSDLRATQARIRQRTAAQRVDETFDTARERWARAANDLSSAITDASAAVNRLSDRAVQRQIEAAASNRRYQIGIGQAPFGDLQPRIERFARENALLVKDIGEKAARDLELLVQDVVSRGGSPAEIKRAIAKVLQTTEKRAALIAQNQCDKLMSDLAHAKADHSGANGFVWLETVSAKPRSDHLDHVGKTFPMDYRPLPRQLPNCKCSMRYTWPETT